LNLEQIGRRQEAEMAPDALDLLLEQLERLEGAIRVIRDGAGQASWAGGD
jgi:hypothetical protein